jgi:hypothetical protein
VATNNLEIFSISRSAVWKFVECGIIMDKDKGLFVKVAGISRFRIYF